MSNPISECYDALIAGLRADTVIDSLVREKNLIDFADVPKPTRDAIATADLPELMVYCKAIRGNLHASSSHSFLTTTWEFQISTGRFDTTVVNELMFAVLRVAVKWHELLRTVAEWEGKNFIKDVRLANGDVGISNPQANRNIRGWASVIQLDIDFGLDLEDIKAT